MKLLCTGDWHITNRRPRSRTDNYQETQEDKINWILNLAESERCSYILQPGDLFDSYKFPDKVKTSWIYELFPENGTKILSVPGQHDLRYHTSPIDNTPYGVLESAECIRVLSWTPFGIPYAEGCDFYGAPWGADVPEVKNKDAFNVLLIHKMIVKKELWIGQEDATYAGTFLRDHRDFDLVVSGDNHTEFHHDNVDQLLINCGSLMRSNIDQRNHEPCVYIVDTKNLSIFKHYIPIQPADKVFNFKEAVRTEEENKKLEELSGALKSKSKLKGLDYRKRLKIRTDKLLSKDEISNRGAEIIGEMLA